MAKSDLGIALKLCLGIAVDSHKSGDDTLEGLMNDILSGGNFGTKKMLKEAAERKRIYSSLKPFQ